MGYPFLFQTLPDIGPKTAERLVFYLLKKPKEQIKTFAQALYLIASNVSFCPICYNFSENNDEQKYCSICKNPKRNKSIVCVVATAQDLSAIERTAEFRGVYHILGGLIDQINNINPENLNIPSLLKRAQQTDSQITEIILGLNPTIEGETTALYLIRQLKPYNVKISRLSRGLPMGADLNYADEVTLGQALQNRSLV